MWDNLTALQQGIVLGAAAVTAIGILFRRFLVPLVDWYRAYPILKEIAEEFKPNAGRSLVDRLSRIEARLDQICDRLDEGG